jgi:hypothetical protein
MSPYIRVTMVTKNTPKNASNFHCEKCNFICFKNSDFNRHITTAKHKMMTNGDINTPKTPTCICGKEFKYRQGLHRHKKSCIHINTYVSNQSKDDIYNDIKHDSSVIIELIKQNHEFKQLLVEQNQTIIQLSKKDTTTNNTINNNNHQKFNLNFFLNDTCKDAMNMSEFIENMNVQFEDIENIGRDGYVTGMTNMILSRIKNLEVTKRPMHCTDLKRETIYIKDNNVWEKDNDNTKLHNMIQCIAHKNYAILPAWRDKNPDCLDSDTSKFDFCIKMMTNLLGDAGEGQVRLDNKVIRNLSKSIIIHKTNDTI